MLVLACLQISTKIFDLLHFHTNTKSTFRKKGKQVQGQAALHVEKTHTSTLNTRMLRQMGFKLQEYSLVLVGELKTTPIRPSDGIKIIDDHR